MNILSMSAWGNAHENHGLSRLGGGAYYLQATPPSIYRAESTAHVKLPEVCLTLVNVRCTCLIDSSPLVMYTDAVGTF